MRVNDLRRLFFVFGNQKALQITFTGSTIYTIDSKWKSMDIFLVGGGGGGGGAYLYAYYEDETGKWSSPAVRNGAGAGSGKTKTQKLIDVSTNKTLTIQIGGGGTAGVSNIIDSSVTAGSNGSNTTLKVGSTTYTANGGNGGGKTSYTTGEYLAKGGNGGCGGGGGGFADSGGSSGASRSNGSGGTNGGNGTGTFSTGGTGQGTTTKAFEETTGAEYAKGNGSQESTTQFTKTGSNIQKDIASTIITQSTNSGDAGCGAGAYQALDYNTQNFTRTYRNASNGSDGVVIVRLYKSNDRPTIEWNEDNMITIN